MRYSDPTGHCIDEGDAPPGATKNNICPTRNKFKRAIIVAGITQNISGTTRFWDGMSKKEQQMLENAGWDKGSFNDYLQGGNASPADLLHDPATYIIGFFALANLPSYAGVTGETVVFASEISGQCFYRGGCDLTPKANELVIDKLTGLLKPIKGISVNLDPRQVEKFGEVFRVDFYPQGLNIIQRGNNLYHYEIVPAYPMTLEVYLKLLEEIILTSINK